MRTQTALQEIWATTTTRITGLRDVYDDSQAYSMFFPLLFFFLLTFLLFFTATDYDDEDTSEMMATENDKEKGDEGE